MNSLLPPLVKKFCCPCGHPEGFRTTANMVLLPLTMRLASVWKSLAVSFTCPASFRRTSRTVALWTLPSAFSTTCQVQHRQSAQVEHEAPLDFCTVIRLNRLKWEKLVSLTSSMPGHGSGALKGLRCPELRLQVPSTLV